MPDRETLVNEFIKSGLIEQELGSFFLTQPNEGLATKEGRGEMYISTPAATSFSDNSTFVAAAGTWTLSPNAFLWDMNTNGQLRYIGAGTRACHVTCTVSMLSSANSQGSHWAIAKNGTVIASSEVERFIGTGADIGSATTHAFAEVVNGDYFSLYCYNSDWTVAQTLTAQRANMFVVDMTV